MRINDSALCHRHDESRQSFIYRRLPPLEYGNADNSGRGQMCPATRRDTFIELSFGQFSTKSRPIGHKTRLTQLFQLPK
ncbi:hypothetical protein B5X24_HaOG206171 [Helicoverpa armigera]|nr:hypothetical protein B5X24_HaOG206171 [Helicoverpa armigera]